MIADALRLVVDHSAHTVAAARVTHNVALGARAASYWTSLSNRTAQKNTEALAGGGCAVACAVGSVALLSVDSWAHFTAVCVVDVAAICASQLPD